MIGLYIHIPFCRTRCPFCDYFSLSHAPEWLQDRYASALSKQLASLQQTVDTLYVGGGTPLAIGAERLERIIANVTGVQEATIELNPEDLGVVPLNFLERFTRLSIGVQSFSPTILRVLNRQPVDEQLVSELTRRWVVNIDLLAGVPGQSSREILEDIRRAIDLGVQHISVYPLEIHYGTPFYAHYKEWDWEEADLLARVEDMLTSAGYEHYEISNYAKPGYQCLHNRLYWLDEDYIAFGPSASGHMGQRRYKWTKNMLKYLESAEGGEPVFDEYVEMSLEESLSVYAIMNLRLLNEGICKERVIAKFGYDTWLSLVDKAKNNPFLTVSESSIKVSNWLFYNRAALSFI
ncbi:coproporphyrinogen III oxidase family protein [Coprothermobacteraceae bacterium]|nr:coproporphyrinogen III oxidase family protein [Coprothermobacteraceae bacterium]